jgi:serine/threonine-protein kinase RsbT
VKTITPLAIRREVDVYVAMAYGRDLASELGLSEIDRTKIEIIVLELARNILRHAHGSGDLLIEPSEQNNLRGVLITARDDGPGIADVARAMQDGFSTAGTLGAGLPGVKRLADRFEIDTMPGSGTTVRAWKWPTMARGLRTC